MGHQVRAAGIALTATIALLGHGPFAFGAPAVENTAHPLVQNEQVQSQAPVRAISPTVTIQANTLGPNLILNPSVETASTGGGPQNWNQGGYGNNTRILTYPVVGYQTPSGLQVTISTYTDGDAKWFFDDVPVTPGKQYQFSDFYNCNVPSDIYARYLLTDGSYTYQALTTLPASGAYTSATTLFTAPANAKSATVFHLISQPGTLRTDEFALREVTPEPTDNFIANPGLEQQSAPGQPLGWTRGAWGSNTPEFTYPVTGVDNTRAARVAIKAYQNGDAKWVFNPVAVPRGVYTYSTQYKATIPSQLTVQYQDQQQNSRYANLAAVPSSSTFRSTTVNVWMPAFAQNLSVFQYIAGIGELTIDNVSLKFKAAPTGIFTTGGVSLTFDDGYLSQYQNAVPKLNAAGLKATFYIITRQLADTGFPTFMSRAQIARLYQQGHEIGAHTRTHPSLPTLTQRQQQDQISGSRQDLLSMGVGPVLTFAYPYGAYNATTLQLIKDAGFTSARATLVGTINPVTDHYQLSIFSVESTTTFDDLKRAIDTAIAEKEWLVLMFHGVAVENNQYSVTPSFFNQLIDYLSAQHTPVVTVSQSMQSMQP